MARTTRSTTAQQQEKDKDLPPQLGQKNSKKRKRILGQDSEDQPASKSSRTDSPESFDGEHHSQVDAQSPPPTLPSTADIPINDDDAARILDILKISDPQGLLDREFPLSDSENVSLRQLLSDSSKHSLSVLKNAVQHLLPISAQPRSRRSSAGDQQLAFCQLALDLLDQASCKTVDHNIDISNLFIQDAPRPHGSLHKHKYALMQSLPTGVWWTSSNSDWLPPSAQTTSLTDLPTGYAELVAIVPTPLPHSTSPPPNLGAYNIPLATHSTLNKWVKGSRRYTSGSFIDYGPYASFAPSFDSKGREIGRHQLAECIWSREKRKRDRGRRGTLPPVETTESAPMEVVENEKEPVSATEVLQGLLPDEQLESLQSVLESLELEDTVAKALDKNRRALERLEELQYARLVEGGTTVTEGSEEWETANALMQSLEALALLRPRSSSHPDNHAPLVPPPEVLRALQSSIPLEPTAGWTGTLPPSNASAIVDDSTLKVQGSAAAPAPAPAATVAASAAASTATPANNANNASYGYQYTGYSQPYRPGAYTPYKPNQAAAYYPNYAANSATPKAAAPGYYGSASGTSTPTQTSYYPAWFQYANGATNPPAPGQGPFATPYAGGTQTPQRTAPVANTVKPYGLPPLKGAAGYYNGSK